MPIDPIPKLKQQLAAELRRSLGDYNQYDAARLLGIDQPRASDLMRNRLDRFSLPKLVRLLARIERPIELRVAEGPPLRRRIGPPRGREAGSTVSR